MGEPETLQPLSASQREALEEAVSRYEKGLGRDGARYLHGRGITAQAARSARLGIVTDPAPGHAKRTGMLAIPYLAADGHPVSIRFRCIEQHEHRQHGKYMSVKGEPSRMYNVGAIHRAENEIHVTEGELDAITLGQVGLPAVAVAGANGWQPHFRAMLAGFGRVWVWADPDDAGAEFLSTVCRSMRQARGVQLDGGDVNETYQRDGAEALLELIS